MLSKNTTIPTVDTALLSAMSVDPEQTQGSAALLQIAGEPLLFHQIQQLAMVGIRKFLIEVDVVSGAFAMVADRMKHRGVSVEFVDSPKDLQDRLGADELLFVMAEGIVANDSLLAEMKKNPSAYIVTLDGRKENEIFERIDLNSFWAGLALLDQRSIEAVASLPDGWSIGSSLLRQALQDSIVHRPLSQDLVTSKLFRRVIHEDDAADITKALVKRRAYDDSGFIEAYVFGPVAARLAPLFWNAPAARRMLSGGLLLTAAAALGLAAIDSAAFAMTALLAALFMTKMHSLLNNDQRRSKSTWLLSGLVWAMLIGAIFLISWDSGRGGFSALFAPMVMLALLLYAGKSPLKLRQKALIASPALAALLLLFSAWFGLWLAGLCLIVVAQLVVLLWPLYFPRFEKDAGNPYSSIESSGAFRP